jgi:hypothetical protein
MGVGVRLGVGVDAGIIFISQPQPHPMLKESRIEDEYYSTSHEIEMFFD